VKATRNLKSTREARARVEVGAEVRVRKGGRDTANRGPGPGTRSTRRARAGDGAGRVVGGANLRRKVLVTENAVAQRAGARGADPVVFIGDTVQVVLIMGSHEGTM